MQVQIPYISKMPFMRSNYDDFGVRPELIPYSQRVENGERVLARFFVGHAEIQNLEYEAIVRSINPGVGFEQRLSEYRELYADGFAPELLPVSSQVVDALRNYALSELGAVALQRLLAWDDEFIARGWREVGGAISETGFAAFGAGLWRPLRVASSGNNPDTVTHSGVLILPDYFQQDVYSTGDIEDPLAVLHHELKAHVLPLKEAEGLVPGREMELICVRLESEMLHEQGLPQRRLNWGCDDGFLDHTLHEASEQYYYGLVWQDEHGHLLQVSPETGETLGEAVIKQR